MEEGETGRACSGGEGKTLFFGFAQRLLVVERRLWPGEQAAVDGRKTSKTRMKLRPGFAGAPSFSVVLLGLPRVQHLQASTWLRSRDATKCCRLAASSSLRRQPSLGPAGALVLLEFRLPEVPHDSALRGRPLLRAASAGRNAMLRSSGGTSAVAGSSSCSSCASAGAAQAEDKAGVAEHLGLAPDILPRLPADVLAKPSGILAKIRAEVLRGTVTETTGVAPQILPWSADVVAKASMVLSVAGIVTKPQICPEVLGLPSEVFTKPAGVLTQVGAEVLARHVSETSRVAPHVLHRSTSIFTKTTGILSAARVVTKPQISSDVLHGSSRVLPHAAAGLEAGTWIHKAAPRVLPQTGSRVLVEARAQVVAEVGARIFSEPPAGVLAGARVLAKAAGVCPEVLWRRHPRIFPQAPRVCPEVLGRPHVFAEAATLCPELLRVAGFLAKTSWVHA